MKLRALRLWNVRKFASRGVALEGIGDGVNVLSAENELGKSTSFDALHAVFFQPHSGTPKAVQLLRPYSGGSPQIEVDVETTAGHFRINKQYYSGKHALVTEIKTGRIVAQADEAEAWISNILRGGASGPAGLLWVQQGTTEIGGGSKTEKDDERKAREDVLTSVTGDEVELLTGGRRMVRVLGKTQTELDLLVTSTGKAKSGGLYAEAQKKLESLRETEDALSSQIQELRTDLDSRRSKLRRLKELTDPETTEQRKSDLSQAKKKLEQAETHADLLATAESQEALALGKQSLAKQRHEEFTAKIANLSKLAEKLATDGNHYGEAKTKLEKAQAADDTSRKALEASEEKIDSATRQLKTAILAKASIEAASKLEEARSRLKKAENLRHDVEALQAECEALSITDTDIDILDQLDQRITILENTIQIGAGTLTIEYQEGKAGTILSNGNPVQGAQAINISTAEVFEIPDIGYLTITPGSLESADELHEELRTSREKYSNRLSVLGFKNLGQAKEQRNLFKAKSSTLTVKKAEFEIHAPKGLGALRKTVAELEANISVAPVEEFDIDEVEKTLESAKDNHREAYAARETARTILQSVKEAYLRVEIELNHTKEQRDQLEQELGAEDERKNNAQSLLGDYKNEAEEVKIATEKVILLRQDAPDLETIRASYTRLNSAISRSEDEREALGKEVAELDGRIAISSENAIEETHEEITGRRQAAETKVAVFEKEIAALQLLKQVLEDARIAAKEQFFQPVMAELKPLLALLLDEASITFDDTTLLPQTLERNGQNEDISFLSGGMREQLAILTRLAFARLLAKEGHPVPVILDDALVYSDDSRIERMFDALHRQANDIQILVFTCRQRAFEQLGGNGLRMVDWIPSS